MVEIILFLFPLLVYCCTRYVRNLNMFSIDIFSPPQETMNNIQFAHRKKYYFGFKHTNNFRPPKFGEWFQSENDILPVECRKDWEFNDDNYKSRCRWILDKNPNQCVKPDVELFHSLPHLREKRINKMLDSESNTVRLGRQWLRGMLTGGNFNSKLEPIIEGMTVTLLKNLINNGFKVVVD